MAAGSLSGMDIDTDRRGPFWDMPAGRVATATATARIQAMR